MQRADRYLTLFVDEANGLLAAFHRAILDLERVAAPSSDAFFALMRPVHTVKSSAAAMGFSAIVELAHAAEFLIVAAQKSGVLKRDQTDLLLQASDVLAQLVAAVARRETPALQSVLAAKLSAAAPMQAPEDRPPQPEAFDLDPAGNGAVPVDASAVTLTIELRAGTRYPQARGLLVKKKLAAHGSLVSFSGPDNVGRIRAVLRSASPSEQIRESIFRVADIEHVTASVETNQPAVERTLHVRADALDSVQQVTAEILAQVARLREAVREAPNGVIDRGLDRVAALARQAHGSLLTARLTPFAVIVDRLERAVRDLSARLDRPCELVIEGGELEADRALLDRLAEPLGHLVRNAIDHGIEPAEERVALGKSNPARLTLKVRRERGRMLVTLADDGRGLDLPALRAKAVERGLLTTDRAAAMSEEESARLSLLPGVSTRTTADDLSGRGIGLDAVRTQTEALGGAIEIASTPRRGTSVSLRLPLAVSVTSLLLVGVNDEVFGLPLSSVAFATEANLSALSGEGFVPRFLPLAGARVPVASLGELLGWPRRAAIGPRLLVVVESGERRAALLVDRLGGYEETLLRPLPRLLDRLPGLAGVTILGSGRPVFVLDVDQLSEGIGADIL